MEIKHRSDCAVNSEPAYPRGKCNCGALESAIGILIGEYTRNSNAYSYPALAKEIIEIVRQESIEVITAGLTYYEQN